MPHLQPYESAIVPYAQHTVQTCEIMTTENGSILDHGQSCDPPKAVQSGMEPGADSRGGNANGDGEMPRLAKRLPKKRHPACRRSIRQNLALAVAAKSRTALLGRQFHDEVMGKVEGRQLPVSRPTCSTAEGNSRQGTRASNDAECGNGQKENTEPVPRKPSKPLSSQHFLAPKELMQLEVINTPGQSQKRL